MPFTIEQLNIGQSENFEKTFTEGDVLDFADISGDKNPVHIDKLAAQKSIFGQRVVHGALVASLSSSILGTKMPGEGTIYLAQDNKFTAPVFIGDTIVATCEIIEIIKEKNIVKLATTAVNQHGKLVIKGIATVMAPKLVYTQAWGIPTNQKQGEPVNSVYPTYTQATWKCSISAGI